LPLRSLVASSVHCFRSAGCLGSAIGTEDSPSAVGDQPADQARKLGGALPTAAATGMTIHGRQVTEVERARAEAEERSEGRDRSCRESQTGGLQSRAGACHTG